MPIRGCVPGDKGRWFEKSKFEKHAHDITLGAHAHGGVTAGTDTSATTDLGTKTTGLPKISS